MPCRPAAVPSAACSSRRAVPCAAPAWLILGLAVWTCAARAADEAAVSVLADFEDGSVAAQITEVKNVLVADCKVERVAIPARGQGSLAVEIGATARNVSVACDLTFREATRFAQADRVATFCWLNEGAFGIGFRIHDARGQLFETPVQTISQLHRWVSVAADLKPDSLRRVRGDGPLAYPLEIEGYRITTDRLGKQTAYLDELQVEHHVRPQELVHGGFEFNEPTRIYEPGSSVAAAVVLENRSREKSLALSVDLAWTRPDGTTLQTQRADVTLPASGVDFRSNRRLDFSQRIRDPGLYRLVAQARAGGWTSPSTFEASIAVTPSNRRVSRGRSTFFAVETDLLREPELDQLLEVRVARDLGVNLLALDTMWRELEPKAGAYEFRRLEVLIDALTRKDMDMAALLVLTDPPEWLPADAAARPALIAKLLGALGTRFGERLTRFQLAADVLARPDSAAQLEAVRAVRDQVSKTHPKIEILPPAIRVDNAAPTFDVAAFAKQNPDFPLVFQTEGDALEALTQLAQFQKRGAFEWRPAYRWMHRAEPLTGAGHYYDAEAVLRYYVHAAAGGVASALWFDLRDDDNDPGSPEALRGLVRRDFSPKTSLLGYAAAAGELTGYGYAGCIGGAPEEFESALFVGGMRQVAVLLPRPNRVLPAVLVPVAAVPGDFQAQDFERRARPILNSAAPPLVTTIARPLFVALTLKAAQSEPQFTLASPWLRLPGTLFCGKDIAGAIEVIAPLRLQSSYLQARPAKNAPFACSLTTAALRADAGETVRVDVRLTPKAGQEFERAELPLRVSIEGENLDLTLDVRPLTGVQPLAPGQDVAGEPYRIAALAAGAQRTGTKAVLHCAYEPAALHLVVVVQDPKLVPYHRDKAGVETGDELRLGVAREGSDDHAEVRIDPAADSPTPEPFAGTSPQQVAGWTCSLVVGKGGGARTYEIVIPSAALGARELRAGERLLLATRYINDDADGFPRVPLAWGGGLNGSRSTVDYDWVILGP